MGLSEPALVTPRKKPASGGDPFFSQVNTELADRLDLNRFIDGQQNARTDEDLAGFRFIAKA